MNNIIEQINDLLTQQTELHVNYKNQIYTENIHYSLKYNDVIFEVSKDIKIEMDYEYPSSIPKVYILT